MDTTLSAVCRGYLVGAVGGTVAVMVWGLLVLWLDHTEFGQTICYTRAVELYPERFERADAKVSLVEGARMGRPSAVGLGLKLIAAVLCIILLTLADAGRGERRTAEPGVDNRESTALRRFMVALSSLAGAAVVLLVAVLLL
jgi:hypothetical protein